MTSSNPFVFIVGSPRSGTTLLQNLLNHHHQIAEWYEPYYVWERFFPVPETDIWDDNCLTEKVINRIRNEFYIYRKKSKKPIIVDKTPTNSFNVDLINKIFPEAKFIHLLRDGRDVTLSISKEWKKRADIVENKDIIKFLNLIINMMKRQPFWRYRFMAFFYELKLKIASNAIFNPKNYFNKARWRGEPGWGPRFNNWQNYLQTYSALEFNAMQWVASVETVLKSWEGLPAQNKIEIHYEDLIQHPDKILSAIFDFIGIDTPPIFLKGLPMLKKNNFNKWQTEFSPTEIEEIRPILSPLLERLGYIKKYPW